MADAEEELIEDCVCSIDTTAPEMKSGHGINADLPSTNAAVFNTKASRSIPHRDTAKMAPKQGDNTDPGCRIPLNFTAIAHSTTSIIGP